MFFLQWTPILGETVRRETEYIMYSWKIALQVTLIKLQIWVHNAPYEKSHELLE